MKKILLKKRMLAFVMMLLTALSIIPVSRVNAAENYNGCAAMTHSNVTVYNGVNGSKSGTIYAQEGVTVLNFLDNGWAYVEYSTSSGAKRGYVNLSASDMGCSMGTTCVAKVNTTSNVYYGTNTSAYNKAGTVYSGEYIVVLAKNGDWVYVEYNTTSGRKRGYMSYYNLTCYNRPSVFPDLYTYNKNGDDMYVGSYNVYAGPGVNYAKVGSVANETVTIFNNFQDGRIEGAYIEYYVTGTSQKKSGFILFSY